MQACSPTAIECYTEGQRQHISLLHVRKTQHLSNAYYQPSIQETVGPAGALTGKLVPFSTRPPSCPPMQPLAFQLSF